MTQAENDLRVRRTQKLVQDALIELLNAQHFEKITVGDLAERAMINRSTFYRHYQDKYDLVEKIFEQAAQDLNTTMGKPALGLDQIDVEHSPEPWIAFFEHFAAHARLYRSLLGKNGSSWFMTRIREYTFNVMEERERLREHLPLRKREQETMPREVAVALAANFLISTLVWWLESESSYSPREIATWFRRFLFSGYPHALGFGPLP